MLWLIAHVDSQDTDRLVSSMHIEGALITVVLITVVIAWILRVLRKEPDQEVWPCSSRVLTRSLKTSLL